MIKRYEIEFEILYDLESNLIVAKCKTGPQIPFSTSGYMDREQPDVKNLCKRATTRTVAVFFTY